MVDKKLIIGGFILSYLAISYAGKYFEKKVLRDYLGKVERMNEVAREAIHNGNFGVEGKVNDVSE